MRKLIPVCIVLVSALLAPYICHAEKYDNGVVAFELPKGWVVTIEKSDRICVESEDESGMFVVAWVDTDSTTPEALQEESFSGMWSQAEPDAATTDLEYANAGIYPAVLARTYTMSYNASAIENYGLSPDMVHNIGTVYILRQKTRLFSIVEHTATAHGKKNRIALEVIKKSLKII